MGEKRREKVFEKERISDIKEVKYSNSLRCLENL